MNAFKKPKLNSKKLPSKTDLQKKVKDFINDPEKLIKYKTKNYKGIYDTSDIDSFIHKARIYQKKKQLLKAEDESETFDKELRKKI